MVDREKQHTDLLIRSDGAPPLVIENKVFALPDSDQLDRIAAKFSSENPHLVLLSLTPPAWAGQAWTSPTGHVWIWMSYKELIERLGPTVPKVCAADHYAGATLDRWLRLIGRLGELVELVGQPAIDEPVMLPRQQRQLLETARLDAPVQKMRCQRIASELTHRDLAAYAGLTNGTGLVAWFTDSPHGFVWGWQLQGEDFRLAIVVPEGHPGYGRSDKHKAARQKEARRHVGFFTFGPVKGAGPVGPTRVAFGDYKPNFVYKFIPIPRITVGQAVELGIEYAQRIDEQGQPS